MQYSDAFCDCGHRETVHRVNPLKESYRGGCKVTGCKCRAFQDASVVRTCVCGHESTIHEMKLKFSKCGTVGCVCNRFRDRAIWKYYCGYHERFERLPCAKD